MEIRIFQKGFNYSQDGPGNRLVYHLSGCNLRCPWCSNPEGLEAAGGTACTVEDLLRGALDCRMMFFDGGGVTLTGGEVTVQFEAVKALLTGLKAEGVHTAIETNGLHPRLPELFELTGYLMMDCKHYDTAKHRAVTGASNRLTHENIALAIAAGKRPAVRIPLIGGFNAGLGDAEGFAALFTRLGMTADNASVELLPYHEFGREKYEKSGLPYTMTDEAKISPQTLRSFTETLRGAGLNVIHT